MIFLSSLMGRFDFEKCKRQLSLAIIRLENEVEKEVAKEDFLVAFLTGQSISNKSATTSEKRTHIQSLIHGRNRKDTLSCMITICKYLEEHMISIHYKEAQTELITHVETFLYCSKRISGISELKAVRKQFKYQYGSRFVSRAVENSNQNVDERVVTNLWSYISDDQIERVATELEEESKQQSTLERNSNTYNNIRDSCLIEPEELSVHSGQDEDTALTQQDWEKLPTAFDETSISVYICNENNNKRHKSISRLAPTLPIHIFAPNPQLEIAFDTRTKNPLYVLERIDGVTHVLGSKQRPQFFEEKTLPEMYRSKLSHYFRSGYDRGHMGAAANYGDENLARDTFTLCNVSPQVHSMNCSVWAKLENWCRRVAREEHSSGRGTYIVTGPLWLPSSEPSNKQFHYEFSALGSNPVDLVQVPTHFFKVVAVVDENDLIKKFACFVVPNANMEGGTKTLLHKYVVRWTDLEVMSGLQFFPNLTANKGWKDHANTLAESMKEKIKVKINTTANILSPRNDQTHISSFEESTSCPEHLAVL